MYWRIQIPGENQVNLLWKEIIIKLSLAVMNRYVSWISKKYSGHHKFKTIFVGWWFIIIKKSITNNFYTVWNKTWEKYFIAFFSNCWKKNANIFFLLVNFTLKNKTLSVIYLPFDLTYKDHHGWWSIIMICFKIKTHYIFKSCHH